jgi:protein-ribulosamine 3-kinase
MTSASFLLLPTMIPESIQQYLADFFLKNYGISGNINRFQNIGGGCISFTYQIYISDKNYFLKFISNGKYPNLYQTEVLGLMMLENTDALEIPRIIVQDETIDYQFIVMEFIDQSNKKSSYWSELARGISKIHENKSDCFGLEYDNYIGTLEQINTPKLQWKDFYFENRIYPQGQLAVNDKKLPKEIFRKFELLYNKFDELIPKCTPSLLHGDLWYENIIPNQFGAPTLIDPSVYFGNREMDLAMADLFGGFSQDFFDAYQELLPIEKGYEERRKWHQLYPLLVHVNLFGDNYAKRVINIMNQID